MINQEFIDSLDLEGVKKVQLIRKNGYTMVRGEQAKELIELIRLGWKTLDEASCQNDKPLS